MIVNKMLRAFQAAKEEITEHGGLFGYAGHHAQAFCNVLGESPALKSVLDGFGKAIAVVRIINNATNVAVDAVCRAGDDFHPALLIPVLVPAH